MHNNVILIMCGHTKIPRIISECSSNKDLGQVGYFPNFQAHMDIGRHNLQ